MKIVIWGTGVICEEFKKCLKKDIEIMAYIDTYPKSDSYDHKNVYKLKNFLKCDIEYDYIVVASVYSNAIFQVCLNALDMKRVIFLRPLQTTNDVENYYRNVSVLDQIAPAYKASALLESDKRMGIDFIKAPVLDCYPIYYYDYFRYRTFELVADQLNEMNIQGDIAEVGVFKGYFAKIINAKFPTDMFYLFDSFAGFDKQEAQRELHAGNCNEQFIESFKETSVEQVLSKMKYRDNCIIKKGFFPESAVGIETNFKFVSIDVDFEDSIYASIEWFYPKLVKKGFIFIHDYNEPTLKGVRNAVKRYENTHGSLIKIPIADKCGTLIITK